MAKIPFKLLPGSWGLSGKTRDIAQAEYELTGYDLEKRIAEIKKDDFSEDDFKKRIWEIDLRYGKITEAQYHRWLTDLIKDEKIRELAIAELDYREGKIGEIEYSKKCATLRGEPWVNVVKMDFTAKTSLEGSFELDWNEPFVEKLQAEGYTGPTPDNIVNQWFMELCRNIAMEEFDGTGNFTADSEANLEAVKRWGTETESLPKGRKGHR
jgi:hypothetical protein